MPRKLTTEEFIQRANEVHNEKYDYSKVEYVSNKIKVVITCPEHGDFEQRPDIHISLGQGCSKCGRELSANANKSNTEDFITKAKNVHDNKYDYSKVEYVSSKSKVIIICPEHGNFEQLANNHINFGQGCPHCSNENKGWNRTKFVEKCKSKNSHGTLYVLECYNETETFIKFGITSRTIEERYNGKDAMPYSYRILAEYTGEPEFAYNLEKCLKREMKLQHYVPLIEFGGHATECFIRTEEE